MRKILAGATAKFKAKTARQPLQWARWPLVWSFAFGLAALPFNATQGHLGFNQAHAANGKGGGTSGNNGGGSQGPSSGGGNSSGPTGPSIAGGGGAGPGAGGNPGGGPEGGGLGKSGDSMGPTESSGGDKGGGDPSPNSPSMQRPDTPTPGRADTGAGRGNVPTLQGNSVISGSGKEFQAGPAQGRGANELTSPLFSTPSIPTKGKDRSSPATSPSKADTAGQIGPARTDAATTPSIQQRLGDQSGPDLDSSTEAALIERGWKH